MMLSLFPDLPVNQTHAARVAIFFHQDDVVYLNEPLSFTWATGLGERVSRCSHCTAAAAAAAAAYAVRSRLLPV